jgi:hypothetical protein
MIDPSIYRTKRTASFTCIQSSRYEPALSVPLRTDIKINEDLKPTTTNTGWMSWMQMRREQELHREKKIYVLVRLELLAY